jgi:hypothetical protein
MFVNDFIVVPNSTFGRHPLAGGCGITFKIAAASMTRLFVPFFELASQWLFGCIHEKP